MSELLSVTRGLKVSYIKNNKKKKKIVPTNHPVEDTFWLKLGHFHFLGKQNLS